MVCGGRSDARLASALAAMALALALASLAPCAAFADAPTEKSETVNVDVSASGAVEGVEVETTLKNEAHAQVLDDWTQLTGIEADGDATFTNADGALSWNASGENVKYTGTTDKPLPISIKTTFTLDGDEVAPDEIAGKSGEVAIRYDYANEDVAYAYINGASEEIRTPFTCLTALMVDAERFTGISVKNGKVIEDGDNVIIAGYAMPGLKQSLGPLAANADVPDYFEVTAHVEGFALKPAMTIVTAGLMADFDVESLGLGDTEEATSGLSAAMDQLTSGSAELANGMHALADGADELGDGAYEMAQGSRELSYGLYQLAYGVPGTPGLVDLEDASDELVDGLGAIDDALGQLANVKRGLPAAAANLEKLAGELPDATAIAALEKAIAASDLDPDVQLALAGILQAIPSVSQISSAVSQSSDGLGELSANYSALVAEAESLPEGVEAALSAAKMLYAGSSSLAEGAGQLAAGASALTEGMQAAADGSDQLTEGLTTFEREGLAKIIDTIDSDIGGFKKRLSALSDASGAYDNFAGKVPGTPSSVQFVFESKAISQ